MDDLVSAHDSERWRVRERHCVIVSVRAQNAEGFIDTHTQASLRDYFRHLPRSFDILKSVPLFDLTGAPPDWNMLLRYLLF